LCGVSCLILAPFLRLALGRPAEVRPLLALSGATLVVKDFVFVLICFAICRAASGAVPASRALRTLGLGLGGVLIQIASIPAGHFIIVGGAPSYRELLTGGRLIVPALLVASFLAALMVCARMRERRLRSDQEWASLELEG
jgi:hypothetical protein